MALLQMNLLAQSLMRTVPVNVILPVDKMTLPGMPRREDKPYKTLYLLHGVFGDHTDWLCGSRIQRYAEEHDLAVVMPAGENAFYVDQPDHHNYYGQFIGEELVELTRRMFPLSRAREDTFIGGLSMGGYGAMRNGLKYGDTFGRIISLSGALVLDGMPRRTDDVPFFLESRSYAQACFGDLDALLTSDKNPKELIRRRQAAGQAIPKIYMACGDQDGLLEANRQMVDFLRRSGVDVTFEVGPGGHEWDFWDAYIRRAIDWLPTENGGLGVNSGNVGI